MTDWGAVREHLIGVMGWYRGIGLKANRLYSNGLKMLAEYWQPDKGEDQFFMLKDMMRERGWFWSGWENNVGATVEYWCAGKSHTANGEDLMKANALAAAEATGYE